MGLGQFRDGGRYDHRCSCDQSRAISHQSSGSARHGDRGSRKVRASGAREEPNSGAKIAGYVYSGENYPVLETSSDGTSVKIGGRAGTDNLNGGWVAAEFMVIN